MVEGYDISEGGGSPSESAGHLPTEMAFANEIARRIDEKLTFFLTKCNTLMATYGNQPMPNHANNTGTKYRNYPQPLVIGHVLLRICQLLADGNGAIVGASL